MSKLVFTVVILCLLIFSGCASMQRRDARVRVQESALRARGCQTITADGDIWHDWNFNPHTRYVLDDDLVMWSCPKEPTP